MKNNWCLVLVVFGDLYSTSDVNHLVESVLKFSKGCDEIILITDKVREHLRPEIRQKSFPDFFNRDLFFRPGYVAKLSLFSKNVLPVDKTCVYLDLDTVVFGDIGKIANLVSSRDDMFILPSVFWEISAFTRLLTKLTFGRFYKVGNSSIMAYHSGGELNISAEFEKLFIQDRDQNDAKFKIDDIFISWCARYIIKPVPRSLGVMFRKELLARSRMILWLRANLWFSNKRRKNLVAVTLNGVDLKPERLLALEDGKLFADHKGRFGYWDDTTTSGLKTKILNSLGSTDHYPK
jgi:hypothetical protein